MKKIEVAETIARGLVSQWAEQLAELLDWLDEEDTSASPERVEALFGLAEKVAKLNR